jgi:hypothetical protein
VFPIEVPPLRDGGRTSPSWCAGFWRGSTSAPQYPGRVHARRPRRPLPHSWPGNELELRTWSAGLHLEPEVRIGIESLPTELMAPRQAVAMQEVLIPSSPWPSPGSLPDAFERTYLVATVPAPGEDRQTAPHTGTASRQLTS